MPERVLVTGVLGCLGAWVARAPRRRSSRRRLRPRGRHAPARARARRGRGTRRARRRGRHRARALGRALDEHGITRVVHLAALQVPFVPGEPGARRARQRRRHGERVRGRARATRAHRRGRLRVVGCGLRPGRPVARARGGRCRADARTTASSSSRTREPPASTGRTSTCRRSAIRPYVVYGPGPRPGPDVRADAGDGGGGARGELRDRLRRRGAVRLRPRRRAHVRPGVRHRHEGAVVGNFPGVPRRSRTSSPRSRRSRRASEIAWTEITLPFPAELEARVSTRGSVACLARRSPTAWPRRSSTSARRREAPSQRGHVEQRLHRWVRRRARRVATSPAAGGSAAAPTRPRQEQPSNPTTSHSGPSNEPVTSRIAPSRKGHVAPIV